MDLDSPWMLLVAAAVLILAARSVTVRYYQRCPHCRRTVRRARRGWLRCGHCGRQYHRSVVLR